jgi:hypothetical protein
METLAKMLFLIPDMPEGCAHTNTVDVFVRYHTGGSMKLNAHILHLAYMVYL